jgi:transcriptional regulator with XRE-family HTH domain
MTIADQRKAFGLRLRALRKQHHWTLKEFAAKLNLPSTQINRYECGINWPPPDKIIEFAALFHCSIDFLLIGTPTDEASLHNLTLLERFRILESFPADLQDVIIKLIDALIFKQHVQSALNPAFISSAPDQKKSPAVNKARSKRAAKSPAKSPAKPSRSSA